MKVLRLTKLKPEALPLTAYVDIELESGIILKDIKFYTKEKMKWIQMPSRRIKEGNEKDCFANMIAFRDTEIESKFKNALIEQIKKEYEK
jgi:DNA-binding cell septation regulator SpoVG